MLANEYFVIAYCTFYLTKVNKSITQEMQPMLKTNVSMNNMKHLNELKN